MQAYIPIVVYKLPDDKKWTAEVLGFGGAVADGKTRADAKSSLASVLRGYLAMLDAAKPLESAELDYLRRLTAPPEGADCISLSVRLASKGKSHRLSKNGSRAKQANQRTTRRAFARV